MRHQFADRSRAIGGDIILVQFGFGIDPRFAITCGDDDFFGAGQSSVVIGILRNLGLSGRAKHRCGQNDP